jgi:hypothetical protein
MKISYPELQVAQGDTKPGIRALTGGHGSGARASGGDPCTAEVAL